MKGILPAPIAAKLRDEDTFLTRREAAAYLQRCRAAARDEWTRRMKPRPPLPELLPPCSLGALVTRTTGADPTPVVGMTGDEAQVTAVAADGFASGDARPLATPRGSQRPPTFERFRSDPQESTEPAWPDRVRRYAGPIDASASRAR
jgi:hypothetical protein